MKKSAITKTFDYITNDYHCAPFFEEKRGNHYNFQNETLS